MRKNYGSYIGLRSFGSMSLNEKCSVRLDDKETDKWGMPSARFHWELTDEDFRRVKYMNSLLLKVAKAMGAKLLYDVLSALARPVNWLVIKAVL
ncbi:MAG: hypothetical protein JKY34_14550 [Kordiimonadaceae bacterium]|nr:hypothetical protein [Kordiimonadaceae bacterium]